MPTKQRHQISCHRKSSTDSERMPTLFLIINWHSNVPSAFKLENVMSMDGC